MANRNEHPIVIFDLGGVLIDWNPRYLYRKVFASEAEMEWFLGEVCSPEWNRLQDAGRPFAEAIAEKQAEHPHYAEPIALYYHRWREMLGGVLADTLEILNAVRATQRPFYALTNWSRETFCVAQELYGFLGWFHGIVVSGAERLAKPDPAIYLLLCERYGVEPTRAIFIDDSLNNVEAAQSLGMTGLHFTDAACLRSELQALGAIP